MNANDAARLLLPFPPTLNHDVGVNGRRRYLTKEYKGFIEAVGWEWLQRRPRRWGQDGRFRVELALAYGSNRRWDVDDRVKPTLDALTRAGVWLDDSQVDEITVRRYAPDRENPRAYLRVSLIDHVPLILPPFSEWRGFDD